MYFGSKCVSSYKNMRDIHLFQAFFDLNFTFSFHKKYFIYVNVILICKKNI